MSLKVNNLICECYFTKNYHVQIRNNNFHILYFDEVHFREVTLLKLSLVLKEEEIKTVVAELENEKRRRQNVFRLSQERKRIISEKYIPKMIHVYTLKESYLDERFLKIVALCKDLNNSNRDIINSVELIRGSEDMYRVPIFTEQFCSDLLRELENIELSNLPKGRPNSMNHYGILLDEVGFYENFINPLRENYLNVICSRLYFDYLKRPHTNSEAGISTTINTNTNNNNNNNNMNNECYGMDSQKAFIVNYKMGEDVDLAPHYDNSEITFNISLKGVTDLGNNGDGNISSDNSKFEDGEVYFEIKQYGSESSYISVSHIKGSAIVHKGSVIHGAHPIVHGHRSNLIIWARSSGIRNKKCPMCKSEPRLKEIQGTGDGFSRS